MGVAVHYLIIILIRVWVAAGSLSSGGSGLTSLSSSTGLGCRGFRVDIRCSLSLIALLPLYFREKGRSSSARFVHRVWGSTLTIILSLVYAFITLRDVSPSCRAFPARTRGSWASCYVLKRLSHLFPLPSGSLRVRRRS